jgi:hypothetical protein
MKPTFFFTPQNRKNTGGANCSAVHDLQDIYLQELGQG